MFIQFLKLNEFSLFGENYFQPRHESKDNDKKDVDSRVRLVISEAEGCSGDATGNTFRDDNIVGSSVNNLSDGMEEIEDADWEDGLIPSLDFADNNEMTIEFDEPSDSVTRKPIRRATAEEKVNRTSSNSFLTFASVS